MAPPLAPRARGDKLVPPLTSLVKGDKVTPPLASLARGDKRTPPAAAQAKGDKLVPPLTSLVKGDKVKLLTAVEHLTDYESLRQALLDFLGVSSVEGSMAVSRGVWLPSPLHTRSGAQVGTAGAAASADPKPKADPATPSASASRPSAGGAPCKTPSAELTLTEASNVTVQEAAADAASTSQASAPESGLGDNDDSFEPVLNRKNKKKARKASVPLAQPQGPAKPKPLVLEGASEKLKASSLEVSKVLRDYKDKIARTLTTKRGTVLVFPKVQEDCPILLHSELPDGLSLRETKAASKPKAATKHHVVIVGVNPELTDAELTEEIARPCKRIFSTKQGGTATWKVKVNCLDNADRLALLKAGACIGHQKHRVTEYSGMKHALQCYKCQGFNHVASVCKSAEKCRICGGDHNGKDCNSEEKQCANCSGNHEASDFRCPKYAAETGKAEAVKLTYAQSVKKGGEQLDCVRLACTVAKAVDSVLTRLSLKLKPEDICDDVAKSVALFYKADVRGNHVHHIAYVTGRQSTRLS